MIDSQTPDPLPEDDVMNEEDGKTPSDTREHRRIKSFVMRAGRMTEGQQRGLDQGTPLFVLPLAGLIGTGLGICNPYNLQIILEEAKIPVLVDAGVGTASDATIAMELGCEAVLMNSAIANAQHPIIMAEAMKHAIVAGRLAYLAGRMPKKLYASASSPLDGLIR